MPTTYRAYEPDQLLLLPPSLEEWLPEDHLAWFVSDAVDALDLRAFHARYEGDGRRRQPFDPSMMVKVLVYAYASGVFSSLFVQVVQLAREAGLVKLGREGIDGTKIKTNASKRKAMSYGRMQERERQLKAEIAQLTRQAEQPNVFL